MGVVCLFDIYINKYIQISHDITIINYINEYTILCKNRKKWNNEIKLITIIEKLWNLYK